MQDVILDNAFNFSATLFQKLTVFMGMSSRFQKAHIKSF